MNLSDLIPTDWFEKPAESSIWLRLYTVIGPSLDQLGSKLGAWIKTDGPKAGILSFGPRLLFAHGSVQGFKIPVAPFLLYTQPDGQPVIESSLGERILPTANYIFLAVPFCCDGVAGVEAKAKRTLDVAAGLLCVEAGLNFMRECVFEGEVRGDQEISASGDPLKVPKPSDGPFLEEMIGMELAEISSKLKKTLEPEKGRLELSLLYLNKAMHKDHGFFEYWTALEVLCHGKGSGIHGRFAMIYNLKSQHEAANLTGLRTVKQWRDDFMHKGWIPTLTADIERYLQLVFLDLFRHELKLPPRDHLASLLQASGYDLSPLGLQDNRTDEQRKAYAEARADPTGP